MENEKSPETDEIPIEFPKEFCPPLIDNSLSFIQQYFIFWKTIIENNESV